MALTDTAIRNAKPAAKPYKLADGKGLFLLVNPNGSKWWRLKYRFGGKEQLLSLGVYPEVPLAGRKDGGDGARVKGARDRRDDARKLLDAGVNPSQHRQMEKSRTTTRQENTFEAVAREWFTKFSPGWAASHSERILRRLERDIFPWIGPRPVGEITPPELLTVLRRIEARGTLDTARETTFLLCGRVPNASNLADSDLNDATDDIRRAIKAGKLNTVEFHPYSDVPFEHYGLDPEAVIEWASNKFPKFPFAKAEVVVGATSVTDYANGRILMDLTKWCESKSAAAERNGDPNAGNFSLVTAFIKDRLLGDPLAASEIVYLQSIPEPLSSENNPSNNGEKLLGQRERDTLLTIIAALAKNAEIDISATSKAASLIEKLTENLGARVAARTVEEHLKRIPEALERKAK